MKFTWGHGITVGYILFVGYILYFVFTSFSQNIDLVAEDYYAQEIVFQDRIEATKNAEKYLANVQVEPSDEGLQIHFDEIVTADFQAGEIYFFRPSDAELDLKIPLTLDESGALLIPKQMLSTGRYEIQLSWKSSTEEYFLKRQVVI